MTENINNAGHCFKRVATLMGFQVAILVIVCLCTPLLVDSSSNATIIIFVFAGSIIQLALIIKIINNFSMAGEYLIEVVKENPQPNNNSNNQNTPISQSNANQMKMGVKQTLPTDLSPPIKKSPTESADNWIDDFV